MEHTNTHSGIDVTNRIEKQVHDVDDITNVVPDWDSLTKYQKSLVTRRPENIDFSTVEIGDMEYAEAMVDPVDEEVIGNVTCVGMHEYFVRNFDPSHTAAEDNVTASHLALGTDGTTTPSASDTDLNTRVYSETVTDHADNGTDLLTSTFIDSTEANGNDLGELGLFTGDPANISNADVFLLNHSTFNTISKDNSKTITFDVTLSFETA